MCWDPLAGNQACRCELRSPLLEFPQLLQDLVVVALDPSLALALADPEPARAAVVRWRAGDELDPNLDLLATFSAAVTTACGVY